MRKVVCYIRVSTEEQASHGHSIEAQQHMLRDYAQGHDLEIVEEFVEHRSAYKRGRPGYERMLKYLPRHRSVTAVLCYKIDRLARNLKDYSELDEMVGVSIISATEALPDNATGKLIGTVQAAFSRYSSAQLGERVRDVLTTRAQHGKWPAPAPVGYDDAAGRPLITPNPVMAPIVRRVFEIYAHEDISLSQLVIVARDLGLRTRNGGSLGKAALHKLLQHPIYYGAIRWKGILYPGKHEPLISKGLFDLVQERLKSGSSPLTKRSFPYRGILTCGYCGCNITASRAKKRYTYYHCTHGRGSCDQPYIREEALSDLLLPVVEGLHMSEDLVRALLECMYERHKDEIERREKELEALQKEEERLRTRRDMAYEDKLDGKITEARWLDMERRWSSDAQGLHHRIVLLGEENEPAVDEVQETFELLQRAPRLYLEQTHEERARLLKTLLSNCVLKGGSAEPVYKKPFDLVAEGHVSGNWLPGEDSNLQPFG